MLVAYYFHWGNVTNLQFTIRNVKENIVMELKQWYCKRKLIKLYLLASVLDIPDFSTWKDLIGMNFQF